jgi:endoglucanase
MLSPADLELLMTLMSTGGISGFEDAVRGLIRSHAAPLGMLSEDWMGNLRLHIPGEGPRVLLTAHMDTVGILVTRIQDDGLLMVRPVGAVDPSLLPGRRVRIPGDWGTVSGTILSPGTREDEAPWDALRVDTGARSAAEALAAGLRPLSPAFLDGPAARLAGTRISGPAVDDRLSCLALLRFAREVAEGGTSPSFDLWCIWTVQNEVGLRGAEAVAATLPTDYVFPIAVSAAHSGIQSASDLGPLVPGEGPFLRAVDAGGVASPDLVAWAERAAAAVQVPLHRGTSNGESESKPFQARGARGLPINLPVRYMHSGIEEADLRDHEALMTILRQLRAHPPWRP